MEYLKLFLGNRNINKDELSKILNDFIRVCRNSQSYDEFYKEFKSICEREMSTKEDIEIFMKTVVKENNDDIKFPIDRELIDTYEMYVNKLISENF